MSVFEIYKGDGGAKFMRPIHSREEYLQSRNSEKQQLTLKAVRSGEEGRKSQLIQMNYSCLPNEDGTLKGSKRMSSTVGMDIDHITAKKMQAIKERILKKKDELGLLMLEESARGGGYHLVFKRRAELDQVGNLKWASELLEVAYDAQAKDITRVFFTTTEAELIYLDDTIFEIKEAADSESESVAVLQCCSSQEAVPQPSFDPEARYNGVLFKDIIAKYWELFNDGKVPTDGDRNVLTFELAVTIRSICGYELEKMLTVVPNYWTKADGTCPKNDADEWRRTIESALKEPKKGMPYRLKQVLQALKATSGVKACGGTLTTPPAMPKKLPPLIRLLTKNVPWFYKPAVANAVFPGLGAHLHGVKFRYWDNVEHEATFMNILIGRQSIGKGTIKKPIEYIMEDIRQRDQPNRQREAEWKQKNPGSKQKKDPRPTDICIQPSLTSAL